MNADPSPPFEGSNILIVEDEMMIAMEYQSLLEERGCIVIGPAANCKKALALIEENRIDACVLDLNLNGKPVGSVAMELQRRCVPFVLVSGYSHLEIAEPEFQGARRLTKPVDERQLLKVLGEIITATAAPETFPDNSTEP